MLFRSRSCLCRRVGDVAVRRRSAGIEGQHAIEVSRAGVETGVLETGYVSLSRSDVLEPGIRTQTALDAITKFVGDVAPRQIDVRSAAGSSDEARRR